MIKDKVNNKDSTRGLKNKDIKQAIRIGIIASIGAIIIQRSTNLMLTEINRIPFISQGLSFLIGIIILLIFSVIFLLCLRK